MAANNGQSPMRLAGPRKSCGIFAFLCCLQLNKSRCHAYSLFSSRRSRPITFHTGSFSGFSSGGNDGKPPRHFDFYRGSDDGDEDWSFDMSGFLMLWPASDSADSNDEPNCFHNAQNDTSNEAIDNSEAHICLRGGGGSLKTKTKKILSNVSKRLPFLKGSDTSQTEPNAEEILSTTKVTSVTAPKSEVLPPEIITQSAEQAKLIGSALTPTTLDATSKSINNWYTSQGYVMNSVTGATLVPSKDHDGQGRVELKVREAKLSNSNSVFITFVEECSNDSEEGEGIINIPIQKDAKQSDSADATQQYQKYRVTSGRTRPNKVAKMVGIPPGSHFRVIPSKWSRIVSSPGGIFGGTPPNNISSSKTPIFSTIHAVRPIPQNDGTISVEIIATENKPFVSMEYGVTKSLYSDQWEGELDFKHVNAFGGGEVATLNVKKGKGSSGQSPAAEVGGGSRLGEWNKRVKDGPTSWRMSIADDSFGGGDTGYDLEVFRDHVGLGKEKQSGAGTNSIGRAGATMRLRFPQTVLPRSVSANFEQVDPSGSSAAATQSASISMNIGPLNVLRSGLSALLTAGCSRNAPSESNKDSSTKPYLSGTISSQKILPLSQSPFAPRAKSPSSVNLAMRHAASFSTKHLPRHEAIMLGLSSRVRGYKYNYQTQEAEATQSSGKRSWASFLQMNNAGKVRPPVAVSNSICGNIEVRIPIRPNAGVETGNSNNLNVLSSVLEGTLVAFGDWAFSSGTSCSDSSEGIIMSGRFSRYCCAGLGYRKVVQGIPLKVDAVLTEHGTGGLFFGIGRDFGA